MNLICGLQSVKFGKIVIVFKSLESNKKSFHRLKILQRDDKFKTRQHKICRLQVGSPEHVSN